LGRGFNSRRLHHILLRFYVSIDLTGQIRDKSRMKTKRGESELDPVVFSEGSTSVKLYPTVNRIYRKNPDTGERELKSEHSQFTLVYYSGNRRVKRKFAD